MIDLRPEDVIHKSYLHRLLMEIADQPVAAQSLALKGGTCAAMLGYLDRFSVDLDFDVLKGADEAVLRKTLHQVFGRLGFRVTLEFDRVLFLQLLLVGSEEVPWMASTGRKPQRRAALQEESGWNVARMSLTRASARPGWFGRTHQSQVHRAR